MSIKKYLFFILITLSFVFACKKDKEAEGILLGEEVVMAESFFTSIIKETDNYLRMVDGFLFDGNKGFQVDCAVITITPNDSIEWPKTITIDYGDTNCLGADGRYRRGMLNIQQPQRLNDTLSLINIGFESFFINDNKIQGAIKYKNSGLNAESLNTFDIEILNGTIITSRGTIHWSSVQSYVIDFTDTHNVLSATGEAVGKLSNGRPFEASIIAPLLSITTCPWIIAGLIEIVSDEFSTETIDFGNAQCNGKANATIDGEQYELLIP